MKDLNDLIVENCERFSHMEDAKVAWRVLSEIEDDGWREMMLPLVGQAVWRHRRSQTRRIEEKISLESILRANSRNGTTQGTTVNKIPSGAIFPSNPISPPPRRVNVKGRISPEMRVWAIKTVKLGKGEESTYGKLTVSQHKERAKRLQAQAEGTLRTVALHEEVAGLLEQAGVNTLNDLIKAEAA